MSIVVTGGAGFIGSCMVRFLNDMGHEDIIIVDNIASTEKWTNLRNKKYLDYVHKNKFLSELDQYEDITHIIHMGACSSTTERDFDYLWNNNFEYSKRLWDYCVEKQISLIYASSAATYGDGKLGFDDQMNIDNLKPLNGYGYSKQLFDLWVKKQKETPKQFVGLKFFNVYGPNEYCKGTMASMVYHGYNQINEDGEVRLFKSHNPQYTDGGQLRDFVYVKDVCKVIDWLMKNEQVSGLFNVGTGRTHSFRELGEAVFYALELPANIKYIDMPEHLRQKYQYYTKAEMTKLKQAGYTEPFMELQDGVKDYVVNYLAKEYEVF